MSDDLGPTRVPGIDELAAPIVRRLARPARCLSEGRFPQHSTGQQRGGEAVGYRWAKPLQKVESESRSAWPQFVEKADLGIEPDRFPGTTQL